MRSKLFLLLLLVLLLPMPSALGISPGRIDIPFQPGFKNTYGFIVIPHMTPYLRLSVYGDLAQYVTLSQTEAVVKNGIGHFTFSVSLPDDLPRPGLYDTRILVTEFPGGFEGGGTGVGAKVAIELQFWVRKPYPGKYLEVTGFRVANTPAGQGAPITLDVIHRGNETIENANAIFTILDANGTILGTVSDQGGRMLPGDVSTFSAVWQTGDNPAGYYLANATLYYDGDYQRLQTRFKVGAELVRITNISAPDFTRATVGRFGVSTESFWSEDIPGTFVELDVIGASEPSSRSESKTLEAWGKRDFIIFWDPKDNKPGDYVAVLKVHYLGKVAEERMPFRIVEKGFSFPWLEAIALLAFLALAYLAYRYAWPVVRPLLAGRRKRGVTGDLQVKGDRSGEPVELVLTATNGTGAAIDAEVSFEVFNSDGAGVASAKAGSKRMGAGESAEFSAKMPVSRARAGQYLARASLSYGDKEGVVERKFSLRDEEKPPWEKFK